MGFSKGGFFTFKTTKPVKKEAFAKPPNLVNVVGVITVITDGVFPETALPESGFTAFLFRTRHPFGIVIGCACSFRCLFLSPASGLHNPHRLWATSICSANDQATIPKHHTNEQVRRVNSIDLRSH